jgi:hypothetical protein
MVSAADQTKNKLPEKFLGTFLSSFFPTYIQTPTHTPFCNTSDYQRYDKNAGSSTVLDPGANPTTLEFTSTTTAL